MTFRTIAGVLPLLAASIAFSQEIHTTVNGEPVHFTDVRPITIGNRVLVPVRGVFEHMGINVEWQPENRSVYANGNGREATLYLGKRFAEVDRHRVALDVPPALYHGRTMVPLRFISEAMGAEVDWDANDNLVAITTGGNGIARVGSETTGERTQPLRHDVVLRANTVIPVTLNTEISSYDAEMGQKFNASVDTQGNDYGLPSGTVVEGHVDAVKPMSGKNPGVLGLAFDRFRFPDGTTSEIDGSLIGLDNKSVNNVNGHLVARRSANRNTKYVGIGAGAGALLAIVSKNNVISSAVIGAALGYLYDQSQQQQRKDVTLKAGTQFGVVLNQDETIPVH